MAAPTIILLPIPFIRNTLAISTKKRTTVCKKKRPLRKVGFNEVSIKVTVLDKLTEEERQNVWYNSSECKRFVKDVKKTVKAVRNGRGHTVCVRGLEKYSSEVYHAMKKKREIFHYTSILQEQRRQKQTGETNPKLLRMLSTHNSTWALQNAIKLGSHDAEEAQSAAIDDDSFSWSETSEASDSTFISLCRRY